MAAQRPTVLCVHGSWHKPFHYAPLEKHLQSLRYPTVFPLLPTCNTPTVSSLPDDIYYVRSIISKLKTQRKSVILVLHSYGGMVGTEAAFGLEADPKKPEDGGIIALIYMCAFMPLEGNSLVTTMGAPKGSNGSLLPWQTFNSETGCTTVSGPGPVFYNDIAESEWQRLKDALSPWPLQAQLDTIEKAAWRGMSGRVWYLICRNDAAIVTASQEKMIRMVEGQGVEVHVETCEAGHSPFLNMPERVGEVVEKAAAAAAA